MKSEVVQKCPVDKVPPKNDFDRAHIMRTDFGPFLNTILQPIYRGYFDDDEAVLLDVEVGDESSFEDWSAVFMQAVEEILKQRLASRSDIVEAIDQKLSDYAKMKQHITILNDGLYVANDGVLTGVVTPLYVAMQIMHLEKKNINSTHLGKRDALIEILSRDELDTILLKSLAVGPGGYLGIASSNFTKALDRLSNRFFNFYHKDRYVLPGEVYKKIGGKVVGMSGIFRASSQQKRRERQQEHSSDGCPVRRERIVDDEVQEPLIITAKKFLVAALKESGTERIPIG